MSNNHYFKPPMPKGYRIFFQGFEVALASEYQHQTEGLINARNITLELQAEPTNKHDPNAILVVGTKKGLLWNSELICGYLPRVIASQIAEKQLISVLTPRPKSLWIGDRGGFSFVIDLIGPKSKYKEIDAARKRQHALEVEKEMASPPTTLQKEYYKFFGINHKKGITHGESTNFILKHQELMIRAGDVRLKQWNTFLDIWDQLIEDEILKDEGIKKPSLAVAIKVFTEWLNDKDRGEDEHDDPFEFAARLVAFKPDLKK